MKSNDQRSERGLHIGDERCLSRRRSLFALFLSAAMFILAAGAPAGAQDEAAPIMVEDGESIQDAVDAAPAGSKIIVRGDHVENVVIQKSGITLVGRGGATISSATNRGPTPCNPNPAAPAPLICVAPDTEEDPTFDDALDGVTIGGFELNGGSGDSIATVFVNDVTIRNNTINGPTCDGIFVIFAEGFSITRNTVDGAGCEGIGALFSNGGHVRNNVVTDSIFSGIRIADTQNVSVRRNSASGNCVGISTFDNPDEGAGVRDEDFPAMNVRILGNTTNENNKTCPASADEEWGLTGILVFGTDNVLIRNNTANDNVGTETTVSAGGIAVLDVFADQPGNFPSTRAAVIGNEATGNSSAVGPVDLDLRSDNFRRVARNTCDVSTPSVRWCN